MPAIDAASFETPSIRSPSDADAVDAVVDDLVVRAVVALGEEPLRDREADAVREALAERSGRRLDARRVVHLGMAGRLRAPLAELLQLVEREVVAGEMERGVLEDARVAGGEDEAVAVGPVRVRRVVIHHLGVEEVRERRERHRGAGMAGVRLLHRVHRERPDRVDRELLDVSLRHEAPRSSRCCRSRAERYASARSSWGMERLPERRVHRLVTEPFQRRNRRAPERGLRRRPTR